MLNNDVDDHHELVSASQNVDTIGRHQGTKYLGVLGP